MIYELRTYTLRPGKLPEFLSHAGGIARPIRENNFGVLEGYWSTDIGPVNQAMHLWRYESLDERQRLRAELSQNKDWISEYLPRVFPLIVRQEIRLMNAVLGPTAPASDGNLYEFRHYRTHVGKAKAWLDLFTEIMPVREKYSKNVAVWHTEAPDPNEVSHMWVYPDLNARNAARAALGEDPAWQEFLGKAAPHLAEMSSKVLVPAPFSPMK